MPAADSPAKLCVICGLDVGRKPRAKDAQGRYTCQECLDRAAKARKAQEKSKQPAPAAPGAAAPGAIAAAASEDNSFLVDLGKPALKPGQKPCPHCGQPVGEAARLCTHCGFNMQTGQRLYVQVQQPKVEVTRERNVAGPDLSGLFGWVPVTGAALLVVGGTYAGSLFVEEVQPIFNLVYFLYFIAVYIFVVIAGFRQESKEGFLLALPAIGIVLILIGGYMAMGNENDRGAARWVFRGILATVVGILYQLYWVLFKCESMHIRGLWTVMAAGGAVIVLEAINDAGQFD